MSNNSSFAYDLQWDGSVVSHQLKSRVPLSCRIVTKRRCPVVRDHGDELSLGDQRGDIACDFSRLSRSLTVTSHAHDRHWRLRETVDRMEAVAVSIASPVTSKRRL